ncbi:Endonuclease/exonuclease/phosphatase [Ephemerocybe angulata]|uniref:Endonuclease/exonuclease/phosphatase n=1 Tax=Ephemerocybe angulata TaxID=980116 RepID=A0A8H6M005_9AGAR|nr:Endonuclease/exonuclease/phosphatase [Tulosesus angulatus]
MNAAAAPPPLAQAGLAPEVSEHDEEAPVHDNEARERANAMRKAPRTKAKLTIGSVNINGAGSDETHYKWSDAINTMRANGIGVLVVQETHLDRARASRIQTTYDKTMFMKSSSELFDTNTSSKGVAILIDRRIVKSTNLDIKWYEVIAGRALMVSIPWRTDTGKLHILGVYAPNIPEQNGRFWDDVAKVFDDNPDWPRPDFLTGDFNMVEEARDREPPSACRAATTAALANLLDRFSLVDGWRKENPNLTRFTWRSRATTGPQLGCRSRIDRIYVNSSLWDDTREWNITIDQPMYTDHELVQTTIYDLSTPFIGKGRWEVPSFLLKHDKFLEQMDSICSAADLASRDAANPTSPQMILEDLKVKMRDTARTIAREAVPKARKKIEDLKKDLEKALDDQTVPAEEQRELTDKLSDEIKDLERQLLDKRRSDKSRGCCGAPPACF